MVLGQTGEFKRRHPKTARSRRELRKQEAKAFENPKKVLFLRGAQTSEVVVDAMNDWYNILKPNCKKLAKRNAFHPFEGIQHLEFLGFKNDSSMFCFGSDSKKRPNNLTIGRMFDFKMLDMVEFGILAQDRMDLSPVAGTNAASIGSKPVFVFEGGEFDSEPFFVRMKNLIVDFFRGSAVREINLSGVDRCIFVSLRSQDETAVQPPSDNCRYKPQAEKGNAVVCFRHYAVVKQDEAVLTNVTKTTVENMRLVDIGPNMDMEIRRVHYAPAADFKNACRLSKEEMAELKGNAANVTGDAMGNLRGQIHMGKQQTDAINLRRFKANSRKNKFAGVHPELGQKTQRDEGMGGGDDMAPAAMGLDGEPARKRRRVAANIQDSFTYGGDADI